jgi:hypothetical protein
MTAILVIDKIRTAMNSLDTDNDYSVRSVSFLLIVTKNCSSGVAFSHKYFYANISVPTMTTSSNKQEMSRPLPPSLSTAMLMDFRGFSFEPQGSTPQETSLDKKQRLLLQRLLQILESAIKLVEDIHFLSDQEEEAPPTN